jgi:hypothetical protein
MSNVISLRRPISVGSQVVLRRMDKNKPPARTIYTVSRIEGRGLFGYQVGDCEPGTERYITKDYKTPLAKTFDSETYTLGVTHLDGQHIE